MDGVATPIIGRPRPLPGHDTPNPAYHPHTLNYEEPEMASLEVRHAANQLLMLQNPHRSQPRAPRRLQDLGAGPIGAKKLAQHRPSSGISAKKLAQHARKHQFWATMSTQGELFRAQGETTWRR